MRLLNRIPQWLAALALLGALVAPAMVQAQAAQRPSNGLIVKLKDRLESAQSVDTGAARERVLGVARQAGVDVAGTRPVGRVAQHLDFGRLLPPSEAQSLIDKLAARPEVEWVVPNVRERRLQAVANPPNDPLFPNPPGAVGQWWLYPASGSNANALDDRRRGVPGFQTTWTTTTTGGPGPVIAVLDTGIVTHPELVGRVLAGYDFVSDSVYANDGTGRDNDPADPGDWVNETDRANDGTRFNECDLQNSSWHGTDISGLVGALSNNGDGVAAINWNARVLPVRVAGKCGAEVRDIVDGMYWAAGLPVAGVPVNPTPARIVNISFGGTGGCEPYQQAIDDLAARGVVVVAAAGNEQGAVVRPAKCPGAIGVGAVNRDGFKTNYSNFGPELTVSTVGGDPSSDGAWGSRLGDTGLLTIDITGFTAPVAPDFARLFGTSFSAPLAAGAVSLMLSVNPALTAPQIINGLRASARPHVVSQHIGTCSAQTFGRCICTTTTCGAGLLDATQAVAFAQNPTGYAPPPRQPENIDSPDVIAVAARGPDEPGGQTPPPPPTPPPDNGGGGGGALGFGWLLALALAVLAAVLLRRRS